MSFVQPITVNSSHEPAVLTQYTMGSSLQPRGPRSHAPYPHQKALPYAFTVWRRASVLFTSSSRGSIFHLTCAKGPAKHLMVPAYQRTCTARETITVKLAGGPSSGMRLHPQHTFPTYKRNVPPAIEGI